MKFNFQNLTNKITPHLSYKKVPVSQLGPFLKCKGRLQNPSGPAARHRSDQTGVMVVQSHSRVPEGYVWSWPHGPISCANWGRSSSLALCVSSYLCLSLFTASSALAAWCAPQPPPWSQLHNHQQLSSWIQPPACLWRKRDSAGLHSAQIPRSADSVNIQIWQLLHWHAVIKRWVFIHYHVS